MHSIPKNLSIPNQTHSLDKLPARWEDQLHNTKAIQQRKKLPLKPGTCTLSLTRIIWQLPPLNTFMRCVSIRSVRVPRQFRRSRNTRHFHPRIAAIHLQVRSPTVTSHLMLSCYLDRRAGRHVGEGMHLATGKLTLNPSTR